MHTHNTSETTETKFFSIGLAVLTVVSMVLTAKFCWDIGELAGWPIAWACVGLAFEFIKCGATQLGGRACRANFMAFCLSAVVVMALCTFSAAASYNVLSTELSSSATKTAERNTIELQLNNKMQLLKNVEISNYQYKEPLRQKKLKPMKSSPFNMRFMH